MAAVARQLPKAPVPAREEVDEEASFLQLFGPARAFAVDAELTLLTRLGQSGQCEKQ